MRQSAAALAFGLGLLFPCLAVQFGHASGWDAVSLWAGIGFGLGFSVPAALDGALAVGERLADLRKANAQTRELELRNAGRGAVANVPPASPATDSADDMTVAQRSRQFEIAHWHIFYRRLVAAGFAYGWDIRTLAGTNEPTRVTGQPGWNVGTDKLKLAGFVVKDNTGTRPTVSEAEWNAGRLWEQVPCPKGEPPDILPPPYTRQQTQHKTPAKQAIVEN
jgi:hypothetical protein